jgi:hypothetical protein
VSPSCDTFAAVIGFRAAWSAVVVALGASLLATGCSSSGGGSATPPHAARLKGAMLTSEDLPSGWKSTPHNAKDDKGNKASQAKLMKCVGAKNTDADRVATVNSPDFSKGSMHVTSSANSYSAESDVASDIAVLRSKKIDACYRTLLQSQIATTLPPNLKLVGSRIVIKPKPGGPSNEVAELRATMTVSTGGKHVPIYVRIAFIRGRMTEAEVQAENVLKPVPDALMTKLASAVSGRVAKL